MESSGDVQMYFVDFSEPGCSEGDVCWDEFPSSSFEHSDLGSAHNGLDGCKSACLADARCSGFSLSASTGNCALKALPTGGWSGPDASDFSFHALTRRCLGAEAGEASSRDLDWCRSEAEAGRAVLAGHSCYALGPLPEPQPELVGSSAACFRLKRGFFFNGTHKASLTVENLEECLASCLGRSDCLGVSTDPSVPAFCGIKGAPLGGPTDSGNIDYYGRDYGEEACSLGRHCWGFEPNRAYLSTYLSTVFGIHNARVACAADVRCSGFNFARLNGESPPSSPVPASSGPPPSPLPPPIMHPLHPSM